MFIHTQSVPSNTWFVSHEMSKKVIVEVLVHYGGNLQRIFPNKIIHVNDDLMAIEFNSTQTGVANVGQGSLLTRPSTRSYNSIVAIKQRMQRMQQT